MVVAGGTADSKSKVKIVFKPSARSGRKLSKTLTIGFGEDGHAKTKRWAQGFRAPPPPL